MTPETLGCEVGAWEGGGQWGTHGGNVKNEERGMQSESERDRQIEEQRGEIEIDWGQTWPLIEGTDQ